MKDYVLCSFTGENTICDINCVYCSKEKKEEGIKKFKENYKYVKGKILPINKNTRKKSQV